MFTLELYHKDKLVTTEDHKIYLTAYRNGQNWKLLRKGNHFVIIGEVKPIPKLPDFMRL